MVAVLMVVRLDRLTLMVTVSLPFLFAAYSSTASLPMRKPVAAMSMTPILLMNIY